LGFMQSAKNYRKPRAACGVRRGHAREILDILDVHDCHPSWYRD
jgi:hypothetical protein